MNEQQLLATYDPNILPYFFRCNCVIIIKINYVVLTLSVESHDYLQITFGLCLALKIVHLLRLMVGEKADLEVRRK